MSPVKSTVACRRLPEPACDRHHRPAPERATLRVAAEHHEGQEKAAGNPCARRAGRFLASTNKTVKVEAPAARSAGIKVKSVAELVEKLKNEAKVI